MMMMMMIKIKLMVNFGARQKQLLIGERKRYEMGLLLPSFPFTGKIKTKYDDDQDYDDDGDHFGDGNNLQGFDCDQDNHCDGYEVDIQGERAS